MTRTRRNAGWPVLGWSTHGGPITGRISWPESDPVRPQEDAGFLPRPDAADRARC
jgi:hypothetical protein